MLVLKRLYFDPDKFFEDTVPPIVFERGLNLIIGERSDVKYAASQREKMNSVGKSISIEAINYCLLKDFADSRIAKIPENVMSKQVYVCLDFEVERAGKVTSYTIRRSRDKKAPIILITDDDETEFEGIDEARKHLEHLLLPNTVEERPSWRQLASILIRDEKTSYEDILHPYPNSALFGFTNLLKPHFYLFGLQLTVLDQVKDIYTALARVDKVLTNINLQFKNNGVEPKEVKLHINDLEDRVSRLNAALKNLEPGEGMKQSRAELAKHLAELDTLLSERTIREYELEKIKRLPKTEEINLDKLKTTYNRYKENLGDLIQKSIEDVQVFKNQVDDFQNRLMRERVGELHAQIREFDQRIKVLDSQIGEINAFLGSRDKIEHLADAVRQQQTENAKLENLRGSYSQLETMTTEKEELVQARNQKIEQIESDIIAHKPEMDSFEDDLKSIHSYITGNKRCQFILRTEKSKKEFVDFDYRVDLDGGSGVNRMKTFMYDALLLLNEATSIRHPGLLIHDNIFASAGSDDMAKGLNYLYEQSIRGARFQYIVTINHDEFESSIPKFKFAVDDVKRAEFTRKEPFLRMAYTEMRTPI